MEAGPSRKPTAKEVLSTAQTAVFNNLSERLRSGTYFPPKSTTPAEYVALTDELGLFAAFTIAADQINAPQLITGSWCRPERNTSTRFWLTPAGIEVQHGAWDEDAEPYDIDERQPINYEELMQVHQLLVGS